MMQTFVGMALFLSTVLAQATGAQQRVVAGDPLARSASERRAIEALLARPVTMHVTRVSLRRAIDVAAASAGVPVQYQSEVVGAYTGLVSLDVTNVPLRVALERLLAGTTLRVVPDGVARVMLVPGEVGQERTVAQGIITGTVLDAETKRPVRGATVLLDEAAHGVLTGDDGTFRLTDVSVGSHRVTVRLIGYGRLVKAVTVSEGQATSLEVLLSHTMNTLDQVVVTGTVIPTELKAVPNAITVITAKQIEERGISHIDQLFRGDVPGLFAQNLGSNALLDEVTMFSRGATALSSTSVGVSPIGTTNPIKTYVDGVELADPKYLSQLDPKSIERIEILTGPQASTIYGSNAINGVMQIFTKRGTASRPQLTLNLLSGWVENNFSSAKTPQHDYSAQLNSVEGRISYNAGGSWNYVGPWTPGKQTARTSGFGGVRLEIPTTAGRVTADMTLRRTITRTLQRGSVAQVRTGYQETGWYKVSGVPGISVPTRYALEGQTLGLTLGYAPTSWWTHEIAVGQDASDTEQGSTGRGYSSRSDTTLNLTQNHTDRRSLRYTTTARVPVTSAMQFTVTAGADAWQDLATSLTASPQALTGTLTDPCIADGYSCTSVTRQPGHNAGSFLQTQLSIKDRLYLTYGLRAEWNPDYGEDALPNYAPRYGAAYTQDVGALTAKLRASYGRSTRPPGPAAKKAMTAAQIGFDDRTLQAYGGDFDFIVANPELGPEYQQGGEGGLELYFGTRGSLIITRYNQTVDHLIAGAKVDSVRELIPNSGVIRNYIDADGYGYLFQTENLNIGSIRNQGWELQGNVNVGPFTTRGIYSWTRSRMIGITPKYRAFFAAQNLFLPGSSFGYLAEHTWAVGMTYAHTQTAVALNVTGIGKVQLPNSEFDEFKMRNLYSGIRLQQNRLNMSAGDSRPYVKMNPGYALADLTATHRFSSRMEWVFQVQNLTDWYANDYDASFATMGRQGKTGFRVSLQ